MLLQLLGAPPERSAGTDDKSHSVEQLHVIVEHCVSTQCSLVSLQPNWSLCFLEAASQRRLEVVSESSCRPLSQRISGRHGAVFNGGSMTKDSTLRSAIDVCGRLQLALAYHILGADGVCFVCARHVSRYCSDCVLLATTMNDLVRCVLMSLEI